MNNYNNLYKLINDFNERIKKLEIINTENSKTQNCNKNNIISNNSIIESYQIHQIIENNSNKKYFALLFNNFEYSMNLKKSSNNKLNSFIKLFKSNILINYSLQLELNSDLLSDNVFSVALGIKTKLDPKIKIIKGTKYIFTLNDINIINGNLTIQNTTIYLSNYDEELCMIVDFSSTFFINSKKSIIKLLYI